MTTQTTCARPLPASGAESVLLAIPVFNEAASIAGVLAAARRHVPRVLAVDDGSTDATPALLRDQPDVQVVTHPENRGYGQSLASAFAYAQRAGYRWLITMDADEQHEPAQLPRFLRACARDDADVISGSRYPRGFGSAVDEAARAAVARATAGCCAGIDADPLLAVVNETVEPTTGKDASRAAPPDRRRINAVVTALLRQRLGLRLTDAFCGFKAYRVAALADLLITVPGYAVPMQAWVQSVRAGHRVRELPVPLKYPDPNRHFGGHLDDPMVRLRHYLAVFEEELAQPAPASPPPPCLCAGPPAAQ